VNRNVVEVVVPVYNEEKVLAASIRRLNQHLTESFPFPSRIVIADNASVDNTLAVAEELAAELPRVSVLHLDEKGRGRALRAAWSRSDADVVCYMDVDLSTDLSALLPLVAPLVSGHSDLAIGTRLARNAQVERSPKREFISRAYNWLLRTALWVHFSDAQCGFKAARADAVRELLRDVRDDEWFFDTELLVLAERRGMRVHEVPVDWVEDPDSRVAIVSTALADLRGVERLAAQSEVVRFGAVGILSTIAYAALYVALRDDLTAGAANALALLTVAVGSTLVNDRLTFGMRGRAGVIREHLLSGLVFLLALALTSGALAALADVVRRPSLDLQVAVLVVVSTGATLWRYLGLRRRAPRAAPRPSHGDVAPARPG
jgi:glycosyltransferase involved in cell wall biosynthesis